MKSFEFFLSDCELYQARTAVFKFFLSRLFLCLIIVDNFFRIDALSWRRIIETEKRQFVHMCSHFFLTKQNKKKTNEWKKLSATVKQGWSKRREKLRTNWTRVKVFHSKKKPFSQQWVVSWLLSLSRKKI